MTHDELVQIANRIFATIKKRDDLYFSTGDTSKFSENEYAEMQDHCQDITEVVRIEGKGIGAEGSGDCYAIANVLLRAINRSGSHEWRQGIWM